MRALGIVPMYPSGELSQLGRGFWEMVLARSTSHGKLRGMLNNWLPDPDSHNEGQRNKSSSNLQAKQVVDESDEWRRVKEVDGRGEHGEEHTQSTRVSSISSVEGRSSEHTHGHDSPNSCARANSAETAPTGDALTPPRNDTEVPPTPSTEEIIRQAAVARQAEPTVVLPAELPAEPCVEEAPHRLRTCAECNEPIAGAVFMLHDSPYCCQRHRLSAYHKTEKRRAQETPDVAPIAPCSSGVGLAARYGTW